MMIATATTTAVLGLGRKAGAPVPAAGATGATGAMGVVVRGRAMRVRRQWSRG